MTGMELDVLCSAGAKGGTSKDGNIRDAVFSEQFIPCIKEISDKRYTENLLIMHHQLSCIFRVISSKRKMKIESFEKLCHDCILNIANNFPWALMNHTIHGSYCNTVQN